MFRREVGEEDDVYCKISKGVGYGSFLTAEPSSPKEIIYSGAI